MHIQSPDPILPNHEQLETYETKDRFIDEKILRLQMYIDSIETLNKPPITESTKPTSYRSQLHFRWRTDGKTTSHSYLYPLQPPPTAISIHFRWRTPTMERVLEWVQCGCTFPAYPINPKNELFNFLLKRRNQHERQQIPPEYLYLLNILSRQFILRTKMSNHKPLSYFNIYNHEEHAVEAFEERNSSFLASAYWEYETMREGRLVSDSTRCKLVREHDPLSKWIYNPT
ncbi:Uncharacterized protein BM_BM9353 [Brugia malayi]|uniref:Bm9353 n=1 Tax=Brugia malayi TaxID=6279 RepID=A0A0K0JYZ7_BRUMA|nr:Uncharacterized protein BM_BM9353 [Brugia malayi]CRZ23637.1 Bm9353 [Brugia malayi]VIP00185.1 Uncharacterized protein BM_BM9353 [Brugia malayi]